MSLHQPLESFAGAARSGGTDAPLVRLTAKEIQTLNWHLRGKTSEEIARIQNRSVATVNFHFSNIRRKFAVRSRSAALLKAIAAGVIGVDKDVWRGAHEPD